MNELGFSPSGDPDLASRIGYIEDREYLFRTRVLELQKQIGESDQPERNILAISRDPGSATCLFPVITILRENTNDKLSVVTDGRAEDIIRKSFDVEDKEIEGSLGADAVLAEPDVILAAAAEEKGLETYANATFNEVPMVLVEDYPGATHIFLRACLDRPGLHLPAKICVMDATAKQLMISAFPDSPEIESRIEVTGQPAFDRIAQENVEAISKDARDKLGLTSEDKVVAFMSTFVTRQQIETICAQLKRVSTDFTLAFRKHPRDNTSYEEYFQIFKDNGIKYVDSRELKTDQVSAAADIVITTWSTAGLEAIYRGKPTIHLVDRDVLDVPPELELPLPAVKLGASVGAENIGELPGDIDQLFDLNSHLLQSVNANMKSHYPNDGKNAQRVAMVIAEILKIKGKVD